MALHVLDNGICQTCQPTDHYFVDGMCEGCSDAELLGEDEQALLHALNELDGTDAVRAAWTEELHPRGPGGKFRSNVDRLKEAITKHRAGELKGAHPFDGFNREQLRRVAKARGITLERGEGRDSIAAKLLSHLGEKGGKSAAPDVTKPAKKKLDVKYLAIDRTPITGEQDPELLEAVKGIFEFHDEKTGFRAVLHRTSADFGDLTVQMNIIDANGNKVGTAARHMTYVDSEFISRITGAPIGTRSVEHTSFILDKKDPPIQGGGFATRWLHAVEEEYRNNDVGSITLHADIDVGGYAWAKMGFDFSHPEDIPEFSARLEEKLKSIDDPDIESAARDLIARAGEGNVVPLDFAMFGWTPGAQTWIGKDLMLGSEWQGVKRL